MKPFTERGAALRQLPLRLACLVVILAATSVAAGQGWYLMAPPEDLDHISPRLRACVESTRPLGSCLGGSVLADDRLSRWEQWRAFDSAKQCQDHLSASLFVAKSKIEQARAGPDRWKEYGAGVSVLQHVRAKCIASDDPRLHAE